MRWLAVVLAACGAQPAPAPAPVVNPPVVAAPPAPITCGDVAVILRGPVTDERAAGPMKEEAIAKACLHDKWPQAVIDCIGGTPQPKRCLDTLDDTQRSAYRGRLGVWNDTFPDEVRDEEPVAEVVHVACSSALGDVSLFAPPLAAKGPHRELAVAMRRVRLLVDCHGWSEEVRRCFLDDPASERCRRQLEPAQQQALAATLAEIDALTTKMTQLVPSAFTCKKVVDFHYGDARWKTKLGAMKPAEKTQIIATSRTRMRKACTDEGWSESLRSCVIADGGPLCFHAANVTSWGFPPRGVTFKTGLPACDAYVDALHALASCTQIPKQAVQTMLDQFHETATAIATMNAEQKLAAGRFCTQAHDEIRHSARTLGCSI